MIIFSLIKQIPILKTKKKFSFFSNNLAIIRVIIMVVVNMQKTFYILDQWLSVGGCTLSLVSLPVHCLLDYSWDVQYAVRNETTQIQPNIVK